MEAPETRLRRRFPMRWLLAVVVLLLAAAALYTWNSLRTTHAVSVNAAVEKFRSSRPTPSSSAAALPAGPAAGVYVYATKGSERISVGNLAHTYPDRTTVTVTPGGCGMSVRWDALADRFLRWQLCGSPEGWRIQGYTDVHKFLYVRDTHTYTCPGDPLVRPAGVRSWTLTCDTTSGKVAATASVVGREQRQVAGTTVATTHVHVVTKATGSSLNDGVIDAWLADTTGLPVEVRVSNHGSSKNFGQVVTYDESARFDLTSLTPTR